jgi:hypothetical protein
MRRILAFDPGEVWFGFAALLLDTRKNVVRAETRVLHVPSRSFHGTVNEATFMGLPADVVCEDYRVRPVGHQRWSSGTTLRLMGALQYVTESNDASSWQTVPPGSVREVSELCGPLLDRWREHFHANGNAEWDHAFSAWRVMLRHLMKTEPDLLMRMRHPTTPHQFELTPHWLPVTSKRPRDLLAPAARWPYKAVNV